MSATLSTAFTLTTQRWAATSLCIGYAASVRKDSCTGTACVRLNELEEEREGAQSVLAGKSVCATPLKHATLPLQQSGTPLRRTLQQLMSLQGQLKWFGGRMLGVAAGKTASMCAQTRAAVLHDGKLAMHNTCLPVLFSRHGCRVTTTVAWCA